MPIIRRFSSGPDQPKPTTKPVTVKAVAAKPEKVRKPLPPVKQRLALKDSSKLRVAKRWPLSDEQYVSTDDGVLSVRTPKECTNWPNDFRMRIVRDYREPRSMIDKSLLEKLYDPETVYAIGKRRLMFRQPYETLDNARNKVVILRTEIIDLTDKKAMTLQHRDPAMRILMVYAFTRRMSFNGVASFSVYDWQP